MKKAQVKGPGLFEWSVVHSDVVPVVGVELSKYAKVYFPEIKKSPVL